MTYTPTRFFSRMSRFPTCTFATAAGVAAWRLSVIKPLELSPLLEKVPLPWWAYRTTRPGETSALYFQFDSPRRLVLVRADEQLTPESFPLSNLLYRRLMACRDTGEIVAALSWRGERLGAWGLFLINSAIQRGMLGRFKALHPGSALSKHGFADLLAWLEIRPLLAKTPRPRRRRASAGLH